MTNFQKTWYDEIYESDTKFPQLFIYSTGDYIIDYKGNQSKFQRKSLQCLNCSHIGNYMFCVDFQKDFLAQYLIQILMSWWSREEK